MSAASPVGAGEPPVETSAGPVERAPVDLYLKDDRSGNLVLVPGFTLEEFDAFVQQRKGVKPVEAASRFTIQSLSLSGTAQGDRADLTARFAILVSDELGVRVPLRLDQAVLRSPPVYEGPGQAMVHYDEGGEGYAVLIRGGAGNKLHQLTMDVSIPISRVGDQARLKLSVPRATSSEMRLTVPLARATAEVSAGATVQAVTGDRDQIAEWLVRGLTALVGQRSATFAQDTATDFLVRGVTGDFEMSWHAAAERPARSQPLLEAEGVVVAAIDGQTVQTDARLTVRGYGAEFDHFRVRLPEDAELEPESAVGYQVVDLTTAENQRDPRRIVDVRFAEKQSGPVEVRLKTHTRPGARRSPGVELAGFEVLEADLGRQWGYIGVVTSDHWYIIPGPKHDVRQVNETPSELKDRDDLVAVFEYFKQPCSLRVKANARTSRINVEQDCRLSVKETEARLESELKFNVQGGEVQDFSVDMPGWTVDQVGPANVVAVEGMEADAKGTLSIPLAQPASGEIRLTIAAHQKLDRNTKSIALTIPQPRKGPLNTAAVLSVSPAGVLVVPDDNVELIPEGSKTTHLSVEPPPPQLTLPERQQPLLFYRTDGTAPGVFAAGVRFHDQAVRVKLASKVSLADPQQRALVSQTLNYAIEYKPAESLTVEVPRDLAALDELEFTLDGQRIAAVDLPDPDPRNPSAPVRKRIMLLRPRIGACELKVDYPVDRSPLEPKTSQRLTVPLVMPADGKLADNRLSIAVPPGIVVQPSEGPWTASEVERRDGASQREWTLTSRQRVATAKFGLRLDDRDEAGSTIVERAWIQTWIARRTRQDRAVFRFTTDREHIEVALPEGADVEDARLTLDGVEVQFDRAADGSLVVPLPADSGRTHRIEAWYRGWYRGTSNLQGDPGRLSLDLPHLGQHAWVRRVYWQLILPWNEHVIAAPEGMTPEFQWSWNGLFWSRVPMLDQEALEIWAGTDKLPPIPEETSCYLYSSLGPVNRCDVRTASRILIVLVASGLALMAGLLMIRFSAARHPGFLFAMAVALTALVFLYPAPVLLFSQAAALGLALTLVAGLLRHSLGRRGYRAFRHEAASSVRSHGSVGGSRRPVPAPRPASTETSPPPVPMATSESQS